MTDRHIYDYLTARLSATAGTTIELCDSRGPQRTDRFTLSGVPREISLRDITELIASHQGLPIEAHCNPSISNSTYHYATLRSGRGGQIYTVSMTRNDGRVLVDINSVPPIILKSA